VVLLGNHAPLSGGNDERFLKQLFKGLDKEQNMERAERLKALIVKVAF